jgi:arylsulfatase A-like enzyme
MRIAHHFVIGLVVALAGIVALRAARSQEQPRPNILLIVSDDQGWPDLGCMGLKDIQTPTLDRLAREGVRLTNYYVSWPACTPSRGSILTGRHPLRNGLYDMVRNDLVNYGHRYSQQEYATSPEMTLGLDPREKTLGDMLHAAGYRCGMVGKWDMGQARRYLPLQRGFDFFYGHGNNGIDYYTHERYGVHSLFAGNERSKADQGTYATDLFKREALRFIGGKGSGFRVQGSGRTGQSAGQRQPWFLYLCFNAPHGASSFADSAVGNAVPGVPQAAPGVPKAADERQAAKSGKRSNGGRPGVQAPPEYVARYAATKLSNNLKHYYAAVTCMDDAIGEVLSAIHELGQDDNTLVIFQSDNGGSGNGGNAPLRGQKSTLWEGGLRVPLIARWPGHIPPGRVSDEFLTTLELMPTLAAAAKTQTPAGVKLDGYNMLPTLAGQAPSPRTQMFWEFRDQKAARIGNYKWIDSEKAKGLYDLSNDIGENSDLSSKLPDVAADISARWTAWRKHMEAAEPRGPFRDY